MRRLVDGGLDLCFGSDAGVRRMISGEKPIVPEDRRWASETVDHAVTFGEARTGDCVAVAESVRRDLGGISAGARHTRDARVRTSPG